jgi:hypothetical protein
MTDFSEPDQRFDVTKRRISLPVPEAVASHESGALVPVTEWRMPMMASESI